MPIEFAKYSRNNSRTAEQILMKFGNSELQELLYNFNFYLNGTNFMITFPEEQGAFWFKPDEIFAVEIKVADIN